MWHPKWMEDLDNVDTPRAKMSRFRDYWYILEISGGVQTWKPALWFPNLTYVLMLSANTFYSLPCLVMTAARAEDLGEIGQYLNYAALILVALATVFVMAVYRPTFLGMFDAVESGFYDYEDDGVLNKEVKDMKRRFRIFKRAVQVGIPAYMGLIGLTVLLADSIDITFDTYKFVNASYVNEVYQYLPVKAYYFTTIETTFDKMLMMLSQIMCCVQVATSITSADLILIFFGQELILQLRLLRNACIHMDKRADVVYEKRNGRTAPRNPMSRSHDPKLMKCYAYCLKQVVEHHQIVLKYADAYKTILNWPCGMVILNGSISVAMSALSLMQGGGKASVTLTSCLLLLAELFSLFILCEMGQQVKDVSEDVFHAMYRVEWMDCSKGVQKDFIFMKQRLSQPIVLVAGSLTPLYRDTFNAMMSSAYSYLNLVRASQGD